MKVTFLNLFMVFMINATSGPTALALLTNNHSSHSENVTSEDFFDYETKLTKVETCDVGEEKCPFLDSRGKRKCMKSCQRCDGIVDCPKASDEVGCPCRSKLISDYICDGRVDCTDLSDELGCEECLSDELFCSEGCVQLHSFCEGSPCSEYSRALFCTRLSLGKTDDVVEVSYRSKGYLQKRIRSKWLPVCSNQGANLTTMIDQYCHDVTGLKVANVLNQVKHEMVFLSPPKRWASMLVKTLESTNRTFLSAVSVPSCSSNSFVYVECAVPSCQNNSVSSLPKFSFSRIVGGMDASDDMWNFMVDILRNGISYCAGTIISPRWVLSASHCFLKITGNVFELEAGSHRKSVNSPKSQRIVVTHIIRHRDFDPYTMKNDVALLRLETPLQITRWVRTVCITSNHIQISLKEGVFCSIAGWGYIQENGTLAKTLQEVTIPILKGQRCRDEYIYVDTNKVVCAGYEAGGKDSCQGDSGGPMMCHECNPDKDQILCKKNPWVQAGVVSYGRGCARPGMPGVYTKLESYTDWIFDTIKKLEEDFTLLPTTVPKTECSGLACRRIDVGQCLDERLVCDGKIDCLNGEDETQCEDFTGNDLIPMLNINVEALIDATCPEDLFKCQISQECIPNSLLCDETRNCRDGTDELGCTCIDRLYLVHPDRICDGINDCFDGGDESDDLCACLKGNWFCRKSNRCIPQDKRCDEIVDCRYGEDELNCLALVQNHEGKLYLNKEEIPVGSSKGHLILYSQEKSKWIPHCTNHMEQSALDIVCDYLGFGSSLNITYNKDLPTKYEVVKTSFIIKRSAVIQHERSHNNTIGVLHYSDVGPDMYSAKQRKKTLIFRELNRKANQYYDSRPKRQTCSQVHIECGPKPCGKIQSLYLTDDPPIGRAGLVPWEVSLYVTGGVFVCGGTIVHNEWVITVAKCVENIDLNQSELFVVGGSSREIRTVSSARLLGFKEMDLRVDSIVHLDDDFNGLNSRMSLLHLNKSIERIEHLNSVCLNSTLSEEVNENWKECIVTGKYRDYLTRSLLLEPVNSTDCQQNQICFKDFDVDPELCTSNWSGLSSCRKERVGEAVWTAVGIWTHLGDDKLCGSKKLSHRRLTKGVVDRIHQIIDYGAVNQSVPVPCNGLKCSFGICVPRSGICDGRVSCADLRDEHFNCPIPVTVCSENLKTKKCECPEGQFTCSDRICINSTQVCDGVTHCPSGEDEQNCSCALKTSGNSNSVLSCDGHIDCLDQSDELPCHCNSETEYRCYKSPNQPCIDRKFLCDNFSDCASDEDEEKCVTLSRTVFVEENVLGIPASDKEGHLLIRLMGRWFTYLIGNWNEQLSDRVCSKLGFGNSSRTFGFPLDLTLVAKAHLRSFNAPITSELLRGNASDSTRHNVTYIECTDALIP